MPRIGRAIRRRRRRAPGPASCRVCTNHPSSRVFWPNMCEHGVRPHADLHARFERAARRLEVSSTERVERGDLLRGVAEVLRVLASSSGCDRSSARRASPRRAISASVASSRSIACSSDVRAGAHGVASAVRAVRMNRDPLAERFRRVDRGFHLIEAERLVAGDVGAAARRAVHLDVVGAGVDLLLHRFRDLRDVVYAAARRARRIGVRAKGRPRALRARSPATNIRGPIQPPLLIESRSATSV